MTSRISSSTERPRRAGFLKRQRELAKRRLWPIALTFLSYFLYHVVLSVTILTSAVQNAGNLHKTASETAGILAESAADLFGRSSPSALLIAFPLAVILSMEGFAWLDDRQKVDFYESQPVSRAVRFTDICISSFLYFFFSYAITLELGLLIAGAMGAVTRGLLVEAAGRMLSTTALFLSASGLGVLAVMLTGNMVVAVLAFFVLYLYEPLLQLLVQGYCSEFLTTWSGHPDLFYGLVFNPVYLFQTGGKAAPVRLLALAGFYYLLSWICYKLRKNDHAGSAVVFGPVRTVVRIAVSSLIGLLFGLLFADVFSRKNSFIAILWMVLFTVITACIMQIIYEYDFRALFRRPLETGAAILIALVVYLAFFFDITGYDLWRPDPGKVRDAALIYEGDEYPMRCTDEGEQVDLDRYGTMYMHLENVEDVISLAGYGQDYTKKRRDLPDQAGGLSGDPADEEAIREYRFRVLYRMENGRTLSRSFVLPSNIDPAMMDTVIATYEFREGTFNMYHDDAVRRSADSFILEINNGDEWTSRKLTSTLYEALRDAYLTDLSQFSYNFAKNTRPAARITISYHDVQAGDPHPELENLSLNYPVYASFRNTIQVLEEAALWLEPVDYENLPLEIYNTSPGDLSREERDFLDHLDYSVFRGPFRQE